MLDLSFLRHSCLPLDAALPLPEVCACDLHRQVVPPERRHSVSRCRRALGKTKPACTTQATAASFCQQQPQVAPDAADPQILHGRFLSGVRVPGLRTSDLHISCVLTH